SIANVLHARSRLKVDARSASREPRDERRNLVAQELPLFSIQVVAFMARLRPGDAGVDGTYAFRVILGKVVQEQSVYQRENRRVGSDRQCQRQEHGQGEAG